jgi:NAD(P)-dependent dehydrogenase (short-subunit alcohol dehydrogenase family)
MKIVLIGATGFVGAAILQEALNRGHQVTAIVRDPEKLQAHSKLRAQNGDVYKEDEVASDKRLRSSSRLTCFSEVGPCSDSPSFSSGCNSATVPSAVPWILSAANDEEFIV